MLPPIVLLPLYLNYLTPADYGIQAIVTITMDIIGVIISLCITGVLSRFYFEYDEQKDRNEVLSTLLISFSILSLPSLLLLSTQSRNLSNYLLGSSELYHYFLIVFSAFWFRNIYAIGCDYLRVKERSIAYVVVSLSFLLIQISLNVLFIAVYRIGVTGIFLSSLITSALFATVLTIPIMARIGFRFSKQKFIEMAKFSAPLIVSSLSAIAVNSSDRFFIKHFAGLDITGIYSIAYRLGSSIHTFITASFMQYWLPRRFAIYKQLNAKEIYSRFLIYYLMTVLFFGLLLSCTSRDILLIISKPSFYSGYKIVPIIVLSYVVFGLQYYLNIGILIKKKTKYIAYVDSSIGVINILLNFLLISKYGAYGAAYATLGSFILKILCLHFISQKLYPIHYDYTKIYKLIIATSITYMLSSMISYPDEYYLYVEDFPQRAYDLRLIGVQFLVRHSLVVLIFPLLLYLIRFFDENELRYAKQLCLKMKGKLLKASPEQSNP